MSEDDDLERRMRKLAVGHAETRWLTLRVDDDVKELREELRAVRATQQEHTGRFDALDAQLEEHGAQLGEHGAQLREHGSRFDKVDAQLEKHGAQLREHGSRFDKVDAQLQEHSNRFDSIGAQLRSLTQLVGQVLERLPERDR